VPYYLKGMESASDAKNIIFSTDSVDVVKNELVRFLTK